MWRGWACGLHRWLSRMERCWKLACGEACNFSEYSQVEIIFILTTRAIMIYFTLLTIMVDLDNF